MNRIHNLSPFMCSLNSGDKFVSRGEKNRGQICPLRLNLSPRGQTGNKFVPGNQKQGTNGRKPAVTLAPRLISTCKECSNTWCFVPFNTSNLSPGDKRGQIKRVFKPAPRADRGQISSFVP